MSKVVDRHNAIVLGHKKQVADQVAIGAAIIVLAEQVERLADAAETQLPGLTRRILEGLQDRAVGHLDPVGMQTLTEFTEWIRSLYPELYTTTAEATPTPPTLVDVPKGWHIPSFGAGYQQGWDDAVDAERSLRALRPKV